MDGESLTRWSARLAMMLYALYLACRIRHGRREVARMLWTAAWLVYLGHIASAFHFMHHWSHAEAYDHTARQTAGVTGLGWGGGLYVNYAFTLLWTADVLWWWLSRTTYESRPRSVEWTVQAFFAFIAVNATIVFVEGATRWIALAVCLVLAWLGCTGRDQGKAVSPIR